MTRSTFLILLMAAFAAMLGLGVISPFLPEFARQHGANGFWMGMIFAGFGISRGLVMPLVGRLSDRIGRKIFVASGLFLFSAISLFYPLAESVYALTAVRLVHGLAAGMIIPIVLAYVGECSEPGREGRTTSVLNMVFFLGLALGPFVGGYISQDIGFDAVFYAMSLAGIVVFCIVVLFLPDVKGVKTEAELMGSTGFLDLIKFHYIKAILLTGVVITLMISVFMSFMPSVAVKDHVNMSHIGIIISFGIFIAGILQVPFGKLADRFDATGKFLQISMGSTIGMLALFSVPFCPDFDALLLTASFVGLGAAVSMPALTTLSVSVGQRTGMGTWMGIYSAAMSVGFVLTPIVAGVIMDHMGIDSVFYVFGLFAFFGILLSSNYVRLRMGGHKL